MNPLWLCVSFPCLQLDMQLAPSHQHASHRVTQDANQDMHQARLTPHADPASWHVAECTAPTYGAEHTANLPLVLLDTKTMCVVELCATAQQAGIRHGMSLALACALLADLQVLPYDPANNQALLQQLAELLHHVCADIYLQGSTALLLRLDPMLQLYGGLARCLTVIAQQLAPLQLRYMAGLADHWLAASFCLEPISTASDATETHANHIAGTNAHPLRLHQLTPRSLADIEIPLAQLPLPARTIAQLQRVGLERLPQLLALPRADVQRRFSADLGHFLQQLQQVQPIGVTRFLPSEQFCRQLEFVWQPTQWQHIHRALQQLLTLLERFLQQRQLQAHQLCWHFAGAEQQQFEVLVQAGGGEYLQQHWFALTLQKLASQQLPYALRRLRLEAQQLQARVQQTTDLWLPRKVAAAPLSPAQLLALLQARLGPTAVKFPTASADHQVQLQWRLYNCGDPLPEQHSSVAWQGPPQLRLDDAATQRWLYRPLLLWSSPQPLLGAGQKLSALERISSPWWLGHHELRDYFVWQNAQHQLLWCFRDQQSQLFCHGAFS